MLKIFCDSKECDKELDDLNFVFEAQIMETRDNFDLATNKTSKQMMKRQIHFCKDCFIKHLQGVIK